jgi:hypothetical protein
MNRFEGAVLLTYQSRHLAEANRLSAKESPLELFEVCFQTEFAIAEEQQLPFGFALRAAILGLADLPLAVR